MKRSIVIMLVLFLAGFAADITAEEGAKTPEPPMMTAEDQEIAEVREMLEVKEMFELKEILEEMELITDYHLFAEEETDEKED